MSRTTDSDFDVSLDDLAPYLDGVYLLVNAVPDAALVYDAHDCGYYKAEKLAASHDLFSTLLSHRGGQRVLRTNQEMADYIMGCENKLARKILQAARAGWAEIIFVARSKVLVTTGSDAAAVLRDCGRQIRQPLVALPEGRTDSDYVSGYLDAQEAMLHQVAFDASTSKSGPGVLLVGHPFYRHEGDVTGNVAELRRLVSGAGLRTLGLVADGSTFSKLRRCPHPHLVVDLAGGWAGAERLASRLGVDCLSLGLPLGLQGTADWLRQLAGACGTLQRAEKFLATETSRLAKRLQWLIPRFCAGRRVFLFCDRWWLEPLGRALEELGLQVAGYGCCCRRGSTDALPWTSLPLTIPELRRTLQRARRDGALDLVFGNAVVRQLPGVSDLPFIEIGYPASFHHALHQEPLLGFRGLETLMSRLINAMLYSQMRNQTTGMQP